MTPEEQLRDATLRVTGPGVAVLTEVPAHPHTDVDTLAAKVRSRLRSVSTQAVYDVPSCQRQGRHVHPEHPHVPKSSLYEGES
jgi:hypothetical protein